MTYDPRIPRIAAALAADMETAGRDDGSTFVRVVERRRDVWQDAVREAHGTDMLPDDYRYRWIRDLAEMLGEVESGAALDDAVRESADALTSVYTHELTTWVASHAARPGIVDDAAHDLGMSADALFCQRLMIGQYSEIMGVADRLVGALDERADDLAEALGFEEPVE